ncbi:MAG: DUF6973 domain-containing protein [Bacteriovoracia bacterium]
MSTLTKIFSLKDEALRELYALFDKEVRPLTKKPDGTIDPAALGLVDNDVDALRHAYVAGVYTMEYSEKTSDLLGRLNELIDFDYGVEGSHADNMDLWNNAIGRKIAKKAKTRRELFDLLLIELKKGSLILDPRDERKYRGDRAIKRKPKTFVIKILENRTGANIEFLDMKRRIVLTKEEFIQAIRKGQYPGYAVKKHTSGEFPYSTRDKFSFNNLG